MPPGQDSDARPATGPGSRPGGRTGRVRLAVARAVLSMLLDGHTELAHAEVAERSGVHRSTVYRRWPSRTDLLREAIALHNAAIEVPDTGDWELDVRLLMQRLTDFLADPVELAMNSLIAGGTDPELASISIELWEPRMRDVDDLVGRAQERGELPAALDRTAVSQFILCPLILESVMLRVPPRPERLRALGDVLVALSAGAPPPAAAASGGAAPGGAPADDPSGDPSGDPGAGDGAGDGSGGRPGDVRAAGPSSAGDERPGGARSRPRKR